MIVTASIILLRTRFFFRGTDFGKIMCATLQANHTLSCMGSEYGRLDFASACSNSEEDRSNDIVNVKVNI